MHFVWKCNPGHTGRRIQGPDVPTAETTSGNIVVLDYTRTEKLVYHRSQRPHRRVPDMHYSQMNPTHSLNYGAKTTPWIVKA